MQNSDQAIARRKTTGKLIAIFFGTMLLLTFFSNTINNFSLPRVKDEQPTSGSLLREVSGEGTVEARDVINIYTESSMKVLDVKVKVGDTVKQGQELVTLDTGDLEGQLKEEQIRYEKLKISLEKLQDPANQSNLTANQRSIDLAKEKVDDAQKALDTAKKLYEAGTESAENVKKAEKSLSDAKRDYAQKLEDYSTTQEDEDRKLRNTQRDIKDTEYELQLEELKIEKLKKELNSGNIITAPSDGIIKELNFPKGSKTNNSSPVVAISDSTKGFEFKTDVDIDSAKYLAVGDTVEIDLKALSDKNISGVISEITDSQQQKGEKKQLVIDLPQEGLTGGERGDISAVKKTKVYETLVSNTAVGEDNSGKFVYVLKEKKGPLGNELYVQKAYITTDDCDNYKTAVLSGLNPRDRVVIRSDKTLSDAIRVMLER